MLGCPIYIFLISLDALKISLSIGAKIIQIGQPQHQEISAQIRIASEKRGGAIVAPFKSQTPPLLRFLDIIRCVEAFPIDWYQNLLNSRSGRQEI